MSKEGLPRFPQEQSDSQRTTPPDLPKENVNEDTWREKIAAAHRRFKDEIKASGGRITVPRSHPVDDGRKVRLSDIEPIKIDPALPEIDDDLFESQYEVGSVNSELQRRETKVNQMLKRLSALEKAKTIKELAERRKLKSLLGEGLAKLSEARNLQKLIKKNGKVSDNEIVERRILDHIETFDQEHTKLLPQIRRLLYNIES